MGISVDQSISISVDRARSLYALTDDDVKMLNDNGDDKITLSEFRAYGITKNKGLAEYFNSRTNGNLAKLEPNAYAQNPNSVKGNFTHNHNPGLSPNPNNSNSGNNLLMYG